MALTLSGVVAKPALPVGEGEPPLVSLPVAEGAGAVAELFAAEAEFCADEAELRAEDAELRAEEAEDAPDVLDPAPEAEEDAVDCGRSGWRGWLVWETRTAATLLLLELLGGGEVSGGA